MDQVYCIRCGCVVVSTHISQVLTTGFRVVDGKTLKVGVCGHGTGKN